jgi:KUP system potassium uptake protein
MASDHTADKTVTPERIVAAANAAALAKERAPREHEEHNKVAPTVLALGALGVVYGDIGTSPLYSLKEAFTEKSHRLAVDEINVSGVCSLAFWSLVIIISIKYLMLVMRADNKGEGGI